MAKVTPSLISDSELLDPVNSSIKVDAMCGLTHVSWDNSQAFTPVGQLVFFSQFLTCSNLFKSWVDDAHFLIKVTMRLRKKTSLGHSYCRPCQGITGTPTLMKFLEMM